MNNHDLKKLNRVELLQILIDQMKENEGLLAENKRLAQMLDDRRMDLKNCGSIAEAALELNGVFQAADAAAKEYVANARTASESAERMLKAARVKSKEIVVQAEKEAAQIKANAQAEADTILRMANQDSKQIREQAMNVWESFIEGTGGNGKAKKK